MWRWVYVTAAFLCCQLGSAGEASRPVVSGTGRVVSSRNISTRPEAIIHPATVSRTNTSIPDPPPRYMPSPPAYDSPVPPVQPLAPIPPASVEETRATETAAQAARQPPPQVPLYQPPPVTPATREPAFTTNSSSTDTSSYVPMSQPPHQPDRSTTAPASIVTTAVEGQPETAEPGAPDPTILAVLDGKAITEQDVLRELWRTRGRETLEWMIGQAILEKELMRLGLSVSREEVDARLQDHLVGLAKAFPGLTTPEDLTRSAAGMHVEEYRQRSVWPELALRKIMRVALRPTDQQLRTYFAERQADFIQPERVKISQIFIAPRADPDNDGVPGPADWAAAENQILEAHTRLRVGRSGEDFAAVARSYGAAGQQSRWVGRGELLRELEDAAFSLRPGSFSAPLRSGMGYHIILTEEKLEREMPRFDAVREQVREQYEEKRFVLLAGEFMQRLKERAQMGGGLVIGDIPELLPEPDADRSR